ncbi:MAG: prepilin-type N-terminal cleavage/methylation domain-containing protein [Rectinema sp.]|nr:prepilin-type N-terminal cleavage/methylation domain-containing protein [Rectinema sp.]
MNRGFSFVEVIACLMILAGAVLTAVGLLQAGIRAGSEAIVNALAEATAYSAIYDTALLTSSGKEINGFWVKVESTTSGQVVTRTAIVYDTLYTGDPSSFGAFPPLTTVRVAVFQK